MALYNVSLVRHSGLANASLMGKPKASMCCITWRALARPSIDSSRWQRRRHILQSQWITGAIAAAAPPLAAARDTARCPSQVK